MFRISTVILDVTNKPSDALVVDHGLDHAIHGLPNFTL